jgi:alpha-galactosidase
MASPSTLAFDIPLEGDLLDVSWSDDRPASLGFTDSPFVGRTDVPLVEIFTSEEQRARSSQAYHRSAVGERMRVLGVERIQAPGEERVTVRQRDERTGIEARTVLTRPHGVAAVRVENQVRNTSDAPVLITAVASLSIGFGHSEAELDDVRIAVADSEWLAENRWREMPLRSVLPTLSLGVHGQNARGHFGLTSRGAWSTGEHLPSGVLWSAPTGRALAWQIEASAGWHVDLSQGIEGGVLSLLGPTDLEHHFARQLETGESFDAVPVAVAVSSAGRDGAIAQLTAYRRSIRVFADEAALPVVYNDFMNTLMGQPTTDALLPLIGGAADAGAEVFCIDAGWFAEPAVGDWWSTVGEWIEAESRFTGGLAEITDEIQRRGMRVGMWLEPEVVGVHSAAAASLPEEAFFRRFGRRVQEHDRYHLDFRHPAARAHMDEVVDRLVRDHAVSFLKLDYNINPGAGTESDATTAGDGLLAHSRAFRDWLVEIQQRHPGLLIENCSSGGMRADYSLLSVTHMQSTSDQQDFRLYPPIAASAPMSILPEQCGNWAYPSAEMTDEETVFTLVTGLSGRLYLSGFLDRLRPEQRARVAAAVLAHKDLRDELPDATPFWPLGLPAWDDDVVCLGLHTARGDLMFVWDRSVEPRTIHLPGVIGTASSVFPAEFSGWSIGTSDAGTDVSTTAGLTARAFLVTGAIAREEGEIFS